MARNESDERGPRPNSHDETVPEQPGFAASHETHLGRTPQCRHPGRDKPRSNAPLNVYLNGHRVKLELEDARRLFWKARFAWLLPTDFYTCKVGKIRKSGIMFRDVPKASRVLAYHLMRRGHRGLTLEDLRILDRRSEFIGSEVFYARMARLNTALFGRKSAASHPFEFTEVLNGDSNVPVPAYRLKPEVEVLMVVGLADGSSVSAEDVNWAEFDRPG